MIFALLEGQKLSVSNHDGGLTAEGDRDNLNSWWLWGLCGACCLCSVFDPSATFKFLELIEIF